jgi:hypothetical protein
MHIAEGCISTGLRDQLQKGRRLLSILKLVYLAITTVGDQLWDRKKIIICIWRERQE